MFSALANERDMYTEQLQYIECIVLRRVVENRGCNTVVFYASGTLLWESNIQDLTLATYSMRLTTSHLTGPPLQLLHAFRHGPCPAEDPQLHEPSTSGVPEATRKLSGRPCLSAPAYMGQNQSHVEWEVAVCVRVSGLRV